MSRFKDDVQLLLDLDRLIKKEESAAETMDSDLGKALTDVLLPGLSKALPLAQRMNDKRIDTIKRARERLGELLETEHSHE